MRADMAILAHFLATIAPQSRGYSALINGTDGTAKAYPSHNTLIDAVLADGRRANLHGLTTTRFPERQDGNSDHLINSFVLDVNFAESRDDGCYYPEGQAEALSLLRSLPFEPVAILNTGWGLRAHYPFKDPVLLHTEADQGDALLLLRGIRRIVSDVFRQHGHGICDFGFFPNSFRFPGTLNFKHGEVREVRILELAPRRVYSVDDFRRYVLSHAFGLESRMHPAASTLLH